MFRSTGKVREVKNWVVLKSSESTHAIVLVDWGDHVCAISVDIAVDRHPHHADKERKPHNQEETVSALALLNRTIDQSLVTVVVFALVLTVLKLIVIEVLHVLRTAILNNHTLFSHF